MHLCSIETAYYAMTMVTWHVYMQSVHIQSVSCFFTRPNEFNRSNSINEHTKQNEEARKRKAKFATKPNETKNKTTNDKGKGKGKECAYTRIIKCDNMSVHAALSLSHNFHRLHVQSLHCMHACMH